jgi:hypothetical protein
MGRDSAQYFILVRAPRFARALVDIPSTWMGLGAFYNSGLPIFDLSFYRFYLFAKSGGMTRPGLYLSFAS